MHRRPFEGLRLVLYKKNLTFYSLDNLWLLYLINYNEISFEVHIYSYQLMTNFLFSLDGHFFNNFFLRYEAINLFFIIFKLDEECY